MGENQFAKLMRKGRDGKLGMVKPTLEEPRIILEEASDGDTTERASSYIFICSFSKADGSRVYYCTSISVSKDGREVVISNQEKSKKRISNLLQTGVIRWINKNVLSASETQNEESVLLDDSQAATQADNNTASLGVNSPELSASKGTENSGTDKGTSEKFNKGERFLLASGADFNDDANVNLYEVREIIKKKFGLPPKSRISSRLLTTLCGQRTDPAIQQPPTVTCPTLLLQRYGKFRNQQGN